MRIVVISAEYPPVTGGVGDYTHHLAHALVRLGHEVSVLTSSDAAGETRSDDAGGPVAIRRTVRGWGIRHLSSIGRLVRELAPDLVILQYVPHMYGRAGVAPGIALLPSVLRQVSNATVVCMLHEIAEPWSFDLRRVIKAVMHRVQLLLMVLASDRLVVANERHARQVQRWGASSFQVQEIPVGASILPMPVTAEKHEEALHSVRMTDGVLLGDLSPLSVGKRPEDLVSLLQWIGPSAHLLLMGGLSVDEHRREWFMDLARGAGVSGKIEWTGRLSADQLSERLSAVDIYVHTHRSGASTRSTTLASALAHGCPVVAYRGPETPTAFDAGAGMLLARGSDWREFAEHVNALINDSDLRARLSREARDFYVRTLTWEGIARRFVDAAACAGRTTA